MKYLLFSLFSMMLTNMAISQIPLTTVPSGGNKKAAVSERVGLTDITIKYRHPQKNELTWTGRGKTPKWVSEWKAANGSLDGIAVK